MRGKHERWSIFMFIALFVFAVASFLYLPDGVALKLSAEGVKQYYRIKPITIIIPVAVGALGAGMTHHGTVKKGMIIFGIGILMFIGTFLYGV